MLPFMAACRKLKTKKLQNQSHTSLWCSQGRNNAGQYDWDWKLPQFVSSTCSDAACKPLPGSSTVGLQPLPVVKPLHEKSSRVWLLDLSWTGPSVQIAAALVHYPHTYAHVHTCPCAYVYVHMVHVHNYALVCTIHVHTYT